MCARVCVKKCWNDLNRETELIFFDVRHRTAQKQKANKIPEACQANERKNEMYKKRLTVFLISFYCKNPQLNLDSFDKYFSDAKETQVIQKHRSKRN